MISKGDYMEMKAQHDRGVYLKDIAASMNKSTKTVSRALKRGGPPPGKRPNARGSILDPHKPYIDSLLEEGVWNAEVILFKLRERGYEGSGTILRDYIKPKRPLRKSKACVRFETDPGRQMQSDWGKQTVKIAGVPETVHFCVNTLGYSRRMHFWITNCEDAEHTTEAQQRAFRYFGGATKEVLVDNQKAAVIEHSVKDGKTVRLIFSVAWVDFLSCYGAVGRACRPARPETKGKVENSVGYLKGNFFVMYPEADSIEHYNQLAEKWLSEVADPRVHGTTGRVVLEMFEEEATHLLPLPPVPFDTSYAEERIVAWDGFIEVRGNRYAIPDEFCGERVGVRIGLDGTLRVFNSDEMIAVHTMRPRAKGWATVPGYHKNLWAAALSVEKRPLSVYEEVVP